MACSLEEIGEIDDVVPGEQDTVPNDDLPTSCSPVTSGVQSFKKIQKRLSQKSSNGLALNVSSDIDLLLKTVDIVLP